MVDSNFAFIDPVSAVYYGGSGWLRAHQNNYVIDNYVEPAVRTSDTLIGYLPIFQMLPKTSLCIRGHWYPFE